MKKIRSLHAPKYYKKDLSLIIPIKNEQDNIALLIDEITVALNHKYNYEIIVIDDGSDDQSVKILQECAQKIPELSYICHATSYGQSTAIRSGTLNAMGRVMVTLDGDGQNNPVDIVNLYEKLIGDDTPDYLLIVGHRVKRHDSFKKRISSKIANRIRSFLLDDNTPDSGCALKAMTTKTYLQLPYFNHMHRFLPVLMIRHGGRVESVPVDHRVRAHGVSNYGTLDRLWAGIFDLMGVMWLIWRSKKVKIIASHLPNCH